jgi:hypothetical protein
MELYFKSKFEYLKIVDTSIKSFVGYYFEQLYNFLFQKIIITYISKLLI